MLTDVERVKVLAQCHEHASALGIFFGDFEAEYIAIEPLRDLLVGEPQVDMTEAFQLNHCTLRNTDPLRQRTGPSYCYLNKIAYLIPTAKWWGGTDRVEILQPEGKGLL
jgi:hypothetical protein